MERIFDRAESNQPAAHVSRGLGRILRGIIAMAHAVLGTGVLLVGFYMKMFKSIEGIPTSDFAREVIMFIGAVILGTGLALLGKRGIIAVGSLLLLTGIAAYVLWFTSDGPLAVLFPFVGVFVGSIGFFIIAFSAGWLHDH